jgi:hypothetical protein
VLNSRLVKLNSQRLEDFFIDQKAAKYREVHKLTVNMFELDCRDDK